ncbi:retrovirus-related pol polyprotein from transposon TNT 1-94 [Tanacetum coccineum]
MKHVNTKILKENQNLRLELKELTSITETWLKSSNKVNQCINEQIPTQKKKILGIRQITEDTSSCGSKDLVFIKSSADNSDMSITSSNLHKSSEAEDSTLPNHDTDEVPSNKSQRNTTDPSAVVSDSPASDYDSADESSVCSTPLLPLKKLDGAEPGSGPKTVKSILKSKSTFKAETLKGITLNEPSSAPARGNKSSSASKTNSAPAGKLKNVKVEDDPPLAMVLRAMSSHTMYANWTKPVIDLNKLQEHGVLTYILECQIEQSERGISINKERYVNDLLRKYQANPKESHLIAIKRIFRYLEELRDNTFSGSEHEDANEHIEKVLEIVDLFHIPKVTQDQIMLRAFPVSLTGAASRWLRNQPSGSITTWEILKTKFLNKYCPPARTAKKMEEINNFQQEPDESLFRAWERFKELLMKCPQHYLTDMQEVILFYNGLDVPTRQILDSKGAIPSKTTADAKIAIQEMVEYSQKWHNGTSSRTRRPHYTKDCPQKEEGKILEEAYYTQFGAPYQPGGQYRAAGQGFYQRNNGNSSYPDRRPSLEESLTKYMAESAKKHKENSNIIKEIRASTDAAIRNQ